MQDTGEFEAVERPVPFIREDTNPFITSFLRELCGLLFKYSQENSTPVANKTTNFAGWHPTP
jgi:hypothetical protein